MDVLFLCASLYFIKREGGLGEGGQKILPDRTLADFFSVFFQVFFACVFGGGPVGVFLLF